MCKKAVLTVVLALSSVSLAHACIVTYNTDHGSAVARAISEHGWRFKNYAEVCRKLNRANASVEVKGMATVLGGRAIAWASVTLRDKNLPISTAEFGGRSTFFNTTASMHVAEATLPTAINNAVDNMDVDQAIASLNASRNTVRAAHKK